MKLVCLGEALVDFDDTGDLAFQGHPGGSPYNVAIAAARLGTPTGFLSQLSTDAFGRRLLRHLDESGVDTTLIARSGAPTTLAFVQHVDGEPEFAFHANGTADVAFDPRPRPTLPDSVRWIQFGSISLLQEPAATAIEDVVADYAHGRVLFDPNVRPSLIRERSAYLRRLERWIDLSDVVKVSAQDLAWIAPGDEAETIDAWLAARPSHVVVTRGEEGASMHGRDGRTASVAAPPVRVVDTVGAGDSFSGALLSALVERETIPESESEWRSLLTTAARAAASTCGRAGADPPWASEVERTVD